MPWDARPRRAAGLGTLLTLSLIVVVSCTTISVAAPATVAPTAAPTSVATAPPTPLPTLRATPIPTPIATAPATPEATVDATAEPAAAAAVDGALAGLDRKARRQIRGVLANHTGPKGVAGISVAVGLPNGEVWATADGSAEFSPNRPARADTVFAVASVTKTFIAALILALAEEGKLSLDDTFGAYEPLAPRGRTVTIRQLLSHTSGIYNYFANKDYNVIHSEREHRWTYEEIIDLLRPGYCKPGACYAYSNTNFVILGKVAEAAGGAPLHRQLRQRFFRPLGMHDTFYQPAEVPPRDAAHGHWPGAGGVHTDFTRGARVLPFMSAASVASSAGAIASTATDLAIWARALYGGDVLSPESLEEMTTILPEGTYGLGTDVAAFAGRRAYGHRGGLRGFESSMWYFPSEGVSIALVSNQGNWVTDTPFERIARAVFRGR